MRAPDTDWSRPLVGCALGLRHARSGETRGGTRRGGPRSNRQAGGRRLDSVWDETFPLQATHKEDRMNGIFSIIGVVVVVLFVVGYFGLR